METGTKIALLLVFLGVLMFSFGTVKVDEGWNETPDDCRNYNNIVEYDENGTLVYSDTSITVDGSEEDAWSRPMMGVYAHVMAFGFILIVLFGVLAAIFEC